MTYCESILRVYNQYGRRDNMYKARIKILVKALGIEEFRRQVEADWADIKDGPGTLSVEELQRVSAYFPAPAYEKLPAHDAAVAAYQAENKAFANWMQRNVKAHKVPGYAAVVLSLKKTAIAPGDASAEQMDAAADLADRFSFGELRITHMQNLVLADVKQSDLITLWKIAAAQGMATPNVGLLSDIICCPGGDFPQRDQVGLFNIGQHQILHMGDAQFTETETVGQISRRIHLLGAGIAGGNRSFLER